MKIAQFTISNSDISNKSFHLSPVLNYLLIKGEDAEDSIISALADEAIHLGISHEAFRNLAIVTQEAFAGLRDLPDLELKIRSLADTGTEDCAFQDMQSELLRKIEVLGSENDPSTPLGSIRRSLQAIEQDREKIRKILQQYWMMSATMRELAEKQSALMKRLEKRPNQENSCRLLERVGRIIQLKSSIASLDKSLSSLIREKEMLTQDASHTRNLIKEHEEFLNAPDQVIEILGEYEETIMAVRDSIEEKAKLGPEIEEKERELKAIIAKLSPNFQRFGNVQEFQDVITDIEKKLGQANAINEKKMSLPRIDQELKNLQWLTFIYLIFSFSFVLLVVIILFSQLDLSSIFEGSVIVICPFFCFYLLTRLWQQEQASKGLRKKLDEMREDIRNLKGSVETAKRSLEELQRGLNISTSTDLRTRHREYMGALADLESLHQITDVYSMMKTKFDDEKNKLEANVRKILENSDLIAPDEPITRDVLRKFRERYEYAKSLIQEQEKLRRAYNEISSSIERHLAEKRNSDEELKKMEKLAAQEQDETGHIYGRNDLDDAAESYLEREELEAAYIDYQAEIADWMSHNEDLWGDERTPAHIEEEIEHLREGEGALHSMAGGMEKAYDYIERSGTEFRATVFCPAVRKILQGSLFPEILSLKRKIGEDILESIADRGKSPGDSREHQDSTCQDIPLSLYYLLFRIAAARVIAEGLESIALLIEDIPASGDLTAPDRLLSIAESTGSQIICICKGCENRDDIRNSLEQHNIAFQEESTDMFSLIKA
jgi:hypothetical protein